MAHAARFIDENNLPGMIEVGDVVDTLDSKRTITGRVLSVNKKKVAHVRGFEYPGGPVKDWHTHVENLALVNKGLVSKGEKHT